MDIRTGNAAVATIKMPAVGIRITGRVCRPENLIASRVADAMRPCVISADRDTARRAMLNIQEQAVIVGFAARIDNENVGEVLRRRRITKTEPAALVLVRRRRARRVIHAGKRAGIRPKIDRRIDVLDAREVRRSVSQIRGRYEP